jgi:hypothetical protein
MGKSNFVLVSCCAAFIVTPIVDLLEAFVGVSHAVSDIKLEVLSAASASSNWAASVAIDSASLDLSEQISIVSFSSFVDHDLESAVNWGTAWLGDQTNLLSVAVEDFDLRHPAGEGNERPECAVSLSSVCVSSLFDEDLWFVPSCTWHDALLTAVVVLFNDLSLLFAAIGDDNVLVRVGAESEGWAHQALAIVHFLSDFDDFSHFIY